MTTLTPLRPRRHCYKEVTTPYTTAELFSGPYQEFLNQQKGDI